MLVLSTFQMYTTVFAVASDNPLSEESRNFFRDNVFVGEGDIAGARHIHDREDEHIHAHSLELDWYIYAFGLHFYTIPTTYIHLIEHDNWILWRDQFPGFGGSRDLREFTLRSFIEEFNLTPQDLIFITEELTGITMEEFEIRAINDRERFGYHIDSSYWTSRSSTPRAMHAIFSNDMQEIQANFPGHSIIYNNQVFSPEWVMDNMYRAIHEKQLPMDEILRIVGLVGFSLRPDFLLERMDVLLSYSPDLAEVILQPSGMTLERFVDTLESIYQLVRIHVNGNNIHIPFTEQQPVIIDDRTLVPLRAVMEHLGFTVDWEEDEQLVTLTLGDSIVHVQINNYNMQVNNNTVIIDVPPQLINERTMVPVRAIAEATGFTVDWDGNNRIVHISY